ncbi:hypothetical protein [uncultured Kingella sp.]|uniref:hypothetical protein n=1 Tax=uncultured Kingella sp. TaxID=159270 RepID=UPI0025939A18|nr:hypothetical protein [uncultured Kingella sp.]
MRNGVATARRQIECSIPLDWLAKCQRAANAPRKGSLKIGLQQQPEKGSLKRRFA